MWIRYYRNGRRYEESSGSDKRSVAVELLKLREGDIARGVPVTPKAMQLRFEEAAADMVNDYRANGRRTLQDLEIRIRKHLGPFFGGRRMVSLTTADVRAFIAARQTDGAANGEINRELATLKRMFSLAIRSGRLIKAAYIPMLKENNVRQGFFEREQFEAVRAVLPERLRGAVTFAYLTGWRIRSEVLTLEWRQVDLAAGTVRLEPGTTKNSEGRLFPFGDLLPELRSVLEQQAASRAALERAGRICPFVFHYETGARIQSFRKAWGTACRAAGCIGKIPHDFRRTAVRNLVRAGVPERVAMQLTGHKTRCVFDRYDIVNEADLREGVRKLAGTLQGHSMPFRTFATARNRRK